MVHRKKPFKSSREPVIREYGSYSVPPLEDITMDELDADAQRTMSHYFLHHAGSDRVTYTDRDDIGQIQRGHGSDTERVFD